MIRENPWHDRQPISAHTSWFEDLRWQLRLCQSWISTLSDKSPSLSRIRSLETQCAEINHPGGLPALLDDTQADDVLARLEFSIFDLQLILVKSVTEHQIWADAAWRLGRECALDRYRVGSIDFRDLRVLLHAFQDHPLYGGPNRSLYLPQRTLARETKIGLLRCPHQNSRSGDSSDADILCELHSHLSRGFLQALQTGVFVEYKQGSKTEHCSLHWHLEQ